MERKKRPRIIRSLENNIVKDELAFVENLGSKNAREIKIISEKILFEIWHDKHYVIREQHGDEEGKREGVNNEAVERLIVNSFRHLLFYSARIKGFTFLNHENSAITRTILKDSYSQDESLTVVIQVHFRSFNKYEATVITAKSGNFALGAGQYYIEFEDENSSVLKRLDNGKITEVFSCIN
jgi:hypothetical protein